MGESKKENTNLEEREARGKILNKISLIIAIVLICAACFGMGYAVNFKYVVNNTNATSNQKKSKTSSVDSPVDKNGTTECVSEGFTVENLDVTDPVVQNTVKKISIGAGHYCGVWNMYSDKAIFNAKEDIDNSLAFDIVLANLFEEGYKLEEGNELSKADFDAKLASIFGKDYKFTKYEDLLVCPQFKWDESKQAWVQGVSACGGTCGPHSMKRVVKAHIAGDAMTVYVRVLFSKYDSDANKARYYSDAKYTNELTDSLDGHIEYGDKIINETDANFNKGALYKLVFAKENDNYVFNSSELIK
jgi:hypothetical protein